MATWQHLIEERDGSAAVVTLNRPRRRNALSLELMRELLACLEACDADPSVRAVILAAAGPVFCSGHDLGELVDRSVEEHRRIFDVCSELMLHIRGMRVPVIARVQGMATAAGCQLVATCDLAVASESASFATPGVRIGLFCTTPMVALTRAVGSKRAMRMLLTGEAIDARTAAEWGLISDVVPADDLVPAARRLAERVAEASPAVVALGKQAFYAQLALDEASAYRYAKAIMTANAQMPDAREGICAFLGKRAPRWGAEPASR